MSKLEFLKNLVKTHRAKLAAGLTATAFILLLVRNKKILDEFLTEHNLKDEYYALED